MNGASVTTTGAQSYGEAITLGVNTTLEAGAGAISFMGTIDGAQTLSVNSTGSTLFNQAVGATTPLSSLTTNTGGMVLIGTSTVRTTGAQTFNEVMSLLGNVSFTGNLNAKSFATGTGAYNLGLTGALVSVTNATGSPRTVTKLVVNGAAISTFTTSAVTSLGSVLDASAQFVVEAVGDQLGLAVQGIAGLQPLRDLARRREVWAALASVVDPRL